MMINKNRFRVSNDKKVLHKIGKRWVTVSALTLALLGGAAAASTVTTHAASVQSAPTAQVAKKPAQSATPKNIMSAASNMHQGMLATAPKSVAPSASTSAKPNSASQSASSVSSSKASSAVSSVASGSSVALSGSVNDSSASQIDSKTSGNQTVSSSSASAKSNTDSSASSKPVVHMLGLGNPLNTQPSVDNIPNEPWTTTVVSHGVKWSLNKNDSDLLIHDGTLQSDFSHGYGNDATKFVNLPWNKIQHLYTRNTTAPGNFYTMFAGTQLKTADLSGMNLAPVQSMQAMFSGSRLQSLNLGDTNLKNVNNTGWAFDFLPIGLQYLHCNNLKIQSTNSIGDNGHLVNLTTDKVSDLADGKAHTGSFGLINYQYSDIYSHDDGFAKPTTNVKSVYPQSLNNWQFVNQQGQISNTPVMNAQGHVLVAPSYKGLTYKYSKANNSVEFTGGTPASSLGWFVPGANSAIKGANSIKFDNDINTSNVSDTQYMFFNDSNLKSLSLPNSFDTNNDYQMQFMFDGDTNLKSLTLPPKFNAPHVMNMMNMFSSDSSLKSLDLTPLNTTAALTGTNSMFKSDSSLTSLILPNTFNTSGVKDMGCMFKGLRSLPSLSLPDSFNTSNVRNMNAMFIGLYSIKHLDLGDNFNTSNVEDMSGMFSDATSLPSLNLGSKFNTNNVSDFQHMFDSDYSLQNLVLPSNFNTSNGSDMYEMFIRVGRYNSKGTNITLSPGFNTSKAMATNPTHSARDGNHDNGISDMFCYSNLNSLTVPQSANLQLNSKATHNMKPLYQTTGANDSAGKPYTLSMANDFTKGSNDGHTYIAAKNVEPVVETYAFYNQANNDLVGTVQTINETPGSKYTVKNAPSGYHFINNDNTFTVEPNVVSSIKVMQNGKPMSNQPNHDIPVAPTIVNGVITYKYNNKQVGNSINTKGQIGTSAKATVDGNVPSGYQLAGNSDSFNFWSDGGKTNAININLKALPASATVNYQYNNSTKGSHKFTGNDSRATLASGTSTNVTASNEPDMPAGYQLLNGTNNVSFDNNTHDVAIKPIQQTDNIQFMNNGHQVGTTTTKGNDSRTGINGNSTAALPTGYQLAKDARASVANDGKTHQINVTPIQKTDTVDYQLNGVTKGSHQFAGNDVQANGATGTSFDVDSSNDAGMPQGYQLVDKDNRFNYDGGTHNVAIEATNQTANVHYNLPDGINISSGTISGDVNTSTKPTQAPQGYHFAGNVAPYNFTPANAGNNPSDNVTVAPNTVKGTATIHINYNVSGHTYNGSDQHVSINGQYGQPDKVVYPVSYQPTNDDYSTTSQPLDINFNDVAKNGSNDNYNPSATFTYDATEAPDLVIRYDDTTNHNNVVYSDTFTPAQLGIKPQDWVVGNTFTFGTKGTKNAIDVIAAPYGYHLVNNAKGFDYQNGTETITLEPTQINTSTGTKRVVLMAMPMFFHHSQPNKPVTPSSASAKPSSAASSVAPSSASASVAPSSASQSTSSSAPVRQIIDHGSIEPKGNTPEPVNTPTSTPSNKPSDVTPANQPSDVVPVVHKHTTKPSVQKNTQPSDQIVSKNVGKTKAESEPLVEPSCHAAKVRHEAQNHMANLSNKMAQPTVHAANVHASRINNAKRSANVQHKLPQTNEAKATGLMGAASIMAALGLAGAYTDRKRRRE